MICSLPRRATFLSLRVLLGIGLLTALAFIAPTSPTTSAHPAYLTQNLQDSLTLEPDKLIERELKGDETHRYLMKLAAGQFTQINVEQRGVDVFLLVTMPGKEARRIDSSQGQTSREEAFLLAEQAGNVQLEIKAAAAKAPAGKYRLSVEALRPANEQDRAAARAQEIFVRAQELDNQNKAENISTVIKSYEEAVQLFRAANQPRSEAQVLKTAGGASFRSGNMRKAQEFFTQALPRARASGDQSLLAGVLNDLGLTSSRLGDQEKAVACFEELLPIQRAVGNKTGEAIALNNLGGILIGRGEVEKGMAMLEQSLALRRELGDERGEAIMLNNLAIQYRNFGQTERALEMALQALSLRRKLRDKPGEAVTLSNLGDIYASLGDIRQFRESYEQALRIYREAGAKPGEATVLHNMGVALQALGERQQGITYSRRALALRREIGDKSGMADTLDAIGYFYKLAGDFPRALEYRTQALQIRQALGDKARIAASFNNVGLHLHDAGEFQQALEHFQQALKLTQAVSHKSGEASATTNMGLALEKLDRKPEALEYYARALVLGREAADSSAQAAALINLGKLNLALGNSEKALEYFHQSIAVSRAVSLKDLEIKALIELAYTQRSLGRLAEARTHIEAAIALIESLRLNFVNPELRAGYFGTQKHAYNIHLDLLMRLHQREPATKHAENAFQTAEQAKARTLLESLAEARANLRQGIEPALLERERTLQYRLEHKATEQTKLLSGKHTAAQAIKIKQELSALATEYEQLQTEIRQQSPRYAALTQPQPLSLREIQQAIANDADTLLLEYALTKERSYLWAITATTFNSYELPKLEVIEQAAQRVYDLLTARNQPVRFETAEERQARLKQADAELQTAAAALSRMILAPVAGQLGQQRPKRLLIVADGKLQYVPFAALPLVGSQSSVRSGKAKNKPPSFTPLVAAYEIVNLPSASTLAVLRRELAGRKPAPKAVAVLADPIFDKDDARVKNGLANAPADKSATQTELPRAPAPALPASLQIDSELTRAMSDVAGAEVRGALARLPFTRQEAEAIFALAPAAASKLALDFDASQATATSDELSQYRYVHFATHGFLNNQHPELSGLALSLVDRTGREQDGFLRLVEVFNLKLPAELVVLSGCRTGLGREIKGEGLIGLTRGFMYAGAARVMVSLWDVNDRATADLMAGVYRGMLQQGLRPAAALRAAQLALMKQPRWQPPYFWAAFTLQGEPR